MNKNTFVVIMAGGVGTRFWPFSRAEKPKQFLDIIGCGKTLIQLTFDRFKEQIPTENIYVVSNERYKNLIKEQLPGLAEEQLLLEPFQRNTAPCVAYANYKIASKNPGANIIVTPSDHAIFNDTEFMRTINTALVTSASGNKLVTIGIQPHKPETGYGYIQFVNEGEQEDVKKVKTFTEKPEQELAKKFLESGDFVWNAGLFVWQASSIIKAFEKFDKDNALLFKEIGEAYYTSQEPTKVEQAYAQAKNISIDYAILEKADNVWVVLGDFGWSDLGAWDSLYELREKNEEANVIEGNVTTYDVKNCIINGSKDKLIVVEGLEDYLIADNGNSLLICKRGNEQQMRTIVKDVKMNKGEEYL
ncbi:MAG: mannose-1-phosphate guanylyltransferase [Cyclobacteriaceae bacterium]|nr:mannose-1-phosphate guanylyltransferase [Cyclobacteriaceae bacterium]